jgi:hypothetical protein
VGYLHPSAIVVHLQRAPMAQAIRFSPVHFNGSELDTGGSLAPYFQTLVQLRLDSLAETLDSLAPSPSPPDPSLPPHPPPLHSRWESDLGEAVTKQHTHAHLHARTGVVEGREEERQIGVCFLQHRYADAGSCFAKYEHFFGLPDVYDSAFVHVRKSSGWDLLTSDPSRSLSFSLALSLARARTRARARFRSLSLWPPLSRSLARPPTLSRSRSLWRALALSLPLSSSFSPSLPRFLSCLPSASTLSVKEEA